MSAPGPHVPVKGKHQYVPRSKGKLRRLAMYKDKGRLSHEMPDAKIAPDRRWFGNNRTITQEELSQYQNAYRETKADQFQVILHERRLPKSLVHDEVERPRFDLLRAESFRDTFGKGARRRQATLDAPDLSALLLRARAQEEEFSTREASTEEGGAAVVDVGQTRRIAGEVYKVIDSSTVIVEVVDARDPLGTRSRKLEEYIARETPHKHLIFLINKCDLVPRWVVEKAVRRLARERPTLAFRASMATGFGTDQLIAVLRQFQRLHRDIAHLTVGFVGYPNVGKSSVINALRREKVCPVAPIPGETKVWRYVTLSRRIYLIDCPGHVYPEDVTPEDRVLRGVARAERLSQPEQYAGPIADRVRPQYIERTYGIEKFDGPDDLLVRLAMRHGRLGKGGVPDTHAAALTLIRDFQRGRLPWFVLVHSKDIAAPLARRHEVSVERADLGQLQRTVEFDSVDAQAAEGSHSDAEGEGEEGAKHRKETGEAEAEGDAEAGARQPEEAGPATEGEDVT